MTVANKRPVKSGYSWNAADTQNADAEAKRTQGSARSTSAAMPPFRAEREAAICMTAALFSSRYLSARDGARPKTEEAKRARRCSRRRWDLASLNKGDSRARSDAKPFVRGKGSLFAPLFRIHVRRRTRKKKKKARGGSLRPGRAVHNGLFASPCEIRWETA